MYYMLLGEDAPNMLQMRLKVRAEHLTRLQVLQQEGRLLLAGPNPETEDEQHSGVTGSLIVAQFDSLAQAQKWMQEDPYSLEGVFQKVTVKPFKKVFPS
ncbi:YciI family protein [Neisseria sp. Ec49-e6-T10]|uniref:YciI family protein n=1 Tax=Neisseria sp. Ec49-e6-T10 TaxID=3140744 RepID=UPI003EB88B07